MPADATSYALPLDRRDGWLTTALALAVLVLFGRTVLYPFTNWDDIHFLTGNPILQDVSMASLRRIWTPGGVPKELIYIPLTYLSHLLESALFGLSPMAVHTTNVVLHLANALLVYLFCRELSRNQWIAFVAALAFAIHPLQVEAVAWAMGRKDLLSTLFVLASLIAYVRFLRSDSHSWLGGTLACFFLAVLAKPTVIILPLLLFLLDAYLPGPAATRHWGRKIPFLLVGLLTYWVNSRMPVDHVTGVPPLLFRLFSVPWTSAMWVQRTFLLGQPVPFYAWPNQEQWPQILVTGGLFCVALSSLLIQAARKQWRCIWFGLGFFAIAFLPTLNLVLNPRDFVTADRYGYFPLVGVFYMLGVGVQHVASTWRPLYTRWLSIWLILAAFGAWLQVGVWQDSLHVWARVATHYPAHPIVCNNLGMSYIDAKAYNLAEEQFLLGLSYNPDDLTIYENLGRLYLDMNMPEEAISVFSRVLELAPARESIYRDLGVAYKQAGKYVLAIEALNFALERTPDDAETWLQLGNAYAAAGAPGKAEKAYRSGLSFAPTQGTIYFNLGVLLEKQGHAEQALEAYRHATTYQPKLAAAHYNLGTLYLQSGRLREARFELQTAAELEPDADTWLNLARVDHELNDFNKAIQHYQQAIALHSPHAPMAWYFLADIYLRQKEPELARHALRQALILQPNFPEATSLLGQLEP